jgi:hypothetical protein
MQRDGNLVLYNAAGHSVWRSGTAGKAASGYLLVDAGYMVVQTLAKKVVWRTN